MSASQHFPPKHLIPEDDETDTSRTSGSNTDHSDTGFGGVTNNEQKQQQQLALPATGVENQPTRSEIRPEDVKHTISFDGLGPLVINKDGTLSRIHNWAEMTEAERERTARVLGKRNMLRKEAISKEDEEGGGSS